MRILLSFILLLPFIANAQSKKNHLRNGNDLYEDSLFNDAEMKYRKSLEKDQNYFSASYNLADAIYKQERYEESANLFDALANDVKDKNEDTLLAWRNDEFTGSGWSVPGGIVRFKETMENRLREVAKV